jgi:hypothetical protein
MIGIGGYSIHVGPDVEVYRIFPSASLSTETNATAPVSATFTTLQVPTDEIWAGIIVVRQCVIY